MQKKWTLEETNFVKTNYRNLTYKEIANKLNRNISSVEAKIFKLNLKKGYQRKYKVNLKFFNNQSLNTCYWAGFLAADGCIRLKEKQLCLRLAKKDKNHLVSFAKRIEFNGPIKDNIIIKDDKNFKKRTYYSTAISICGAKELINDLKCNFNIISKKTHNLSPPKLDSQNKILSYIKGYIDGDGTIGLEKNRIRLSIVSCSKQFLLWIKSVFDNLIPANSTLKSNVNREHKKRKTCCWSYKISGYRCYEILKMIFNTDTKDFLIRKWDIFSCYKLEFKYDKYRNKFKLKEVV